MGCLTALFVFCLIFGMLGALAYFLGEIMMWVLIIGVPIFLCWAIYKLVKHHTKGNDKNE